MVIARGGQPRPARLAVVAGAVLILATDAGYLAVVAGQHAGDGTLRVPFVAGLMAAAALAAAVSALAGRPLLSQVLLGFSTGTALLLGFLGIFSIGLPLLVAAVPLAAGLRRSPLRPRRLRLGALAAGAVAAMAVTVVGMGATNVPRSCPPTGYSAGSGAGFLTGSYHWTCVNGTLTTGGGECTSGSAGVDAHGTVIAASGC